MPFPLNVSVEAPSNDTVAGFPVCTRLMNELPLGTFVACDGHVVTFIKSYKNFVAAVMVASAPMIGQP